MSYKKCKTSVDPTDLPRRASLLWIKTGVALDVVFDRGINGDRIWTLLCQTVYNLKKLLQLYQNEDIEEHSLMKLGLLAKIKY